MPKERGSKVLTSDSRHVGPTVPSLEPAGRQDIEQIVAAHGLVMLRLAYQLTGSRESAQDLVQDVLMKLLRGARQPQVLPRSYYRRTLVNTYIDGQRLRSSSEIPTDSAQLDKVADDDSNRVLDRDELWRILHRLSERDKSVLILRYYLDETDDQIAEELGISAGLVRVIASRAKKKLQSQLED